MQSREARKASGAKDLSDVELIRWKEANQSRKRTEKDSQEYIKFRTPPQNETFTLGMCQVLSQGMTVQGIFFSFGDSP